MTKQEKIRIAKKLLIDEMSSHVQLSFTPAYRYDNLRIDEHISPKQQRIHIYYSEYDGLRVGDKVFLLYFHKYLGRELYKPRNYSYDFICKQAYVAGFIPIKANVGYNRECSFETPKIEDLFCLLTSNNFTKGKTASYLKANENKLLLFPTTAITIDI